MSLKAQGGYQFNEFEVDLARRTLRRKGRAIAISPKTFNLLAYLVLHPQRVVSRDELLEVLWPGMSLEESDLGQHVFLLRKALHGSVPGDKLVRGVLGRGYEFTPAVTEATIGDSATGSGQPKNELEKNDLEPKEPGQNERKQNELGEAGSDQLRTKPGVVVAGERDEAAVVEGDSGENGPGDPLEASEPAGEAKRLNRFFDFGEEAEQPEVKDEEAETSRRKLGPRLLVTIVILLAAGVGGWWAWRNWHRTMAQARTVEQKTSGSALADRELMGLVLADSDNFTGDPDFDGALRMALTIDLGQSPYLSLAQRGKVAETLNDMKSASGAAPGSAGNAGEGNTGEARVGDSLARELCRRLNDQGYVTTAVSRFAQKYLVTVKAFSCASGRNLAESKGIADTPDGVLTVLDKVAADFREQLGESRASIAQFGKPLFTGRRASLAALVAYAQAGDVAFAGKAADAVPLFQKAIQLDPGFALAYADLGAVDSNLDQHGLAVSNMTKAYQLRDTVDELDRLFIVAAYEDQVTGDIQASIRNYKSWAELYPRDPVPLGNVADLETQIGKPALALDPAKRALELNPEDAISYVILARAQMNLGQFEEADKTCREAIRRQLDDVRIHGILMEIAFLRLDQPAIDEQLSWARNAPDKPAEPFMLLEQGRMDFALGKVKAAQAVLAEAAAGYRQQGDTVRANGILGEEARNEAELGLTEAALAQLARLPDGAEQDGADLSGSTDVPVAWALAGQTGRAESVLEDDLNRNPTTTLWQEYRAPEVRAAIDLSKHQAEDAVTALDPALSYDLRGFAVPALRGRAYLAAKQPERAEEEFHKILDHPGIEPFSEEYPLAQLGLARALAAEGKTVEAGFAYNVVLQIWKDADADLGAVREAKQESARVGGKAETNAATPARNASKGSAAGQLKKK